MGSGVGPQQQRALYGPGLRQPSSCQLGDAPWLGAPASQSALPHATPLPATRARECPNNPEAQAAAARVLDPPTPAAIIASQQRTHPTALAGSLVQLLAGCLEAAPRSSGPASYSAVLCGPVQHYSASLYSAGWGCGYNNMQMMASHLLAARPVGPCRTRELQRLPAMQGCCSRPGSVPAGPSLAGRRSVRLVPPYCCLAWPACLPAGGARGAVWWGWLGARHSCAASLAGWARRVGLTGGQLRGFEGRSRAWRKIFKRGGCPCLLGSSLHFARPALLYLAESAWQAGFDRQGAEQLGGRVQGTHVSGLLPGQPRQAGLFFAMTCQT